jgi:hypothetical protein
MATPSRSACSLVSTTPDIGGWADSHAAAVSVLVEKFITPQHRSTAGTAQPGPAPSGG